MANLCPIASGNWETTTNWAFVTGPTATINRIPTVGDTVYLNNKNVTFGATGPYSVYCDGITNGGISSAATGGSVTISSAGGNTTINMFFGSGILNSTSGIVTAAGTTQSLLNVVGSGLTVNMYDCNLNAGSTGGARVLQISCSTSTINHLKSSAFGITASISGTTMTVTGITGTNNYIQVGSTLNWVGGSATIISGTVSGGTGDYVIGPSQTVGSTGMTCTPASTSTFRGRISGTTLTVYSVDSGTILVNSQLGNVNPFNITGYISSGSGNYGTTGTVLTVTSVPSGSYISLSSTITGVTTGTTISAQTSGPSGGTGTYTVANSQLFAPGGTAGTISVNPPRILPGTRITAQTSGPSGGTGTYTVTNSQTIGTTASPIVVNSNAALYITSSTTTTNVVAVEALAGNINNNLTFSGDIFFQNATVTSSGSNLGLIQILATQTAITVYGNLIGSGSNNTAYYYSLLLNGANTGSLTVYGDITGGSIASTIAAGLGILSSLTTLAVYGNIYNGVSGIGLNQTTGAVGTVTIVGNIIARYAAYQACVITGAIGTANITAADVSSFSNGNALQMQGVVTTLNLVANITQYTTGYGFYSNTTITTCTYYGNLTSYGTLEAWTANVALNLTHMGGTITASNASRAAIWGNSATSYVNLKGTVTLVNSAAFMALNVTGKMNISSSTTMKFFDDAGTAVNLSAASSGNVYPDPRNVLAGSGVYGTGGAGSTPSLTLPPAGFVLSTYGVYGVGGTGTTPTLTLPTASNVLNTAGSYGASGVGSTGNVILPPASVVQAGYAFGANGGQTGTYSSVPTASDISKQILADLGNTGSTYSIAIRLQNVSTVDITGAQIASLT